MKRVYLSLKSVLSAGAATLMGWLGFSSCDNVVTGMAMYGTPTVKYQMKVKVVDQENKAIEGLEVGLAEDNDRELTNKEGIAVIKGTYTGFYRDHQVTLQVKDIDGDKNGVVTNAQTTEQITKDDFKIKGKGEWDNGTVIKDINLKVERE